MRTWLGAMWMPKAAIPLLAKLDKRRRTENDPLMNRPLNFGLGLLALSALFVTAETPPAWVERDVEGWKLHVRAQLLREQAEASEAAIKLLAEQLREIVRVVPAAAVVELKKVPLWISPEYPKTPPRAEYHPDAGWLRENGRDPAMARGVEFTNVRNFAAECKRMPCFVLHELAHAYHDRYLNFDRPDIIATFRKAADGKGYDAVERFHGDPSRPNTKERAYAMTDHKEYFAECSEAYFGQNDFFPFNRRDLEQHDPEMHGLLAKLWNPAEKIPSTKKE